MKTWIIPYIDQPLSFWETVVNRYGEHICSVYFPMPGGEVASGRPRQAEKYMDDFLRYTPLAKNVLINPVVLPQPVAEIAPALIESLKYLAQEFGIRQVTVANPALARLIKEALPGYKVAASILMGISMPVQVLMLQEFVDVIVPDNRLLRDLRGLQRLRQAFGGEICLIVNEACLPGCPYRTQHFYEMGYGCAAPQSLCQPTLEDYPWLRLTSGWVLPRHLSYYDGLYDCLKLAGRVTLREPQRYFQVLDAYIYRQDILPRDLGGGPASVLEAIDMPDALYEKILRCEKNCLACSICQDYYSHAVAEPIQKQG